ncbi:ATP-binding cassette domain-containing protein [Chitinivibrio alkaliphilus]|uniref:ABC transporter, ATP-binding protein n=1 Tax=Chitinivibrio alkaliphilus ACht1 TaxID=1313304 RepID=U7DAU1_9BACT|nr:ATP-binding cassette domain-containing protein [Chitinivibrio alkaliphilus]ERP39147.1 ABC transporter, ATP-binding protein [Chitinivibrio alkaliphilus ACht1]
MYSHVSKYPPTDLSIPEGSTIVFSGPCGSGKSFLLELAAGIKKPPIGTILWNNRDIQTLSELEEKQYRSSFGVALQQPTLINFLSVEKNLSLPLSYHGRMDSESIQRRVETMIQQFEITKQKHNLPERLSTGQKKLVSLARALIASPKVLFLDEPTEGLDPLQAETILDVLNLLGQVPEKTVIISTGDNSIIEKLQSPLYYLDGYTIHYCPDYESYLQRRESLL